MQAVLKRYKLIYKTTYVYVFRCACLDNSQAQQMARQWTLDMDAALTQFVNSFCRKLAVTPARIHPHEIKITTAELASEKYSCLQGIYTC